MTMDFMQLKCPTCGYILDYDDDECPYCGLRRNPNSNPFNNQTLSIIDSLPASPPQYFKDRQAEARCLADEYKNASPSIFGIMIGIILITALPVVGLIACISIHQHFYNSFQMREAKGIKLGVGIVFAIFLIICIIALTVGGSILAWLYSLFS